MIDRYLLRYFLAIIDQGNFTRAAAQCNVSQPTLSAGIAKLEATLGCTLFHRTNRRVSLTADGVALAGRARRIEAEFLAAERETKQADGDPVLRIGILTTIPGTWIETFVTRLETEGLGGTIELVEGREREQSERLARGRIDLALTILRGDTGRMERRPLFSEGYSLATHEGHPLANRPLIDGEDLADNPMIVRRHCELLSDTSRYFTARGVRPPFPARTTSDDQALRLVRAGLGVTVMPDCFHADGVVRPRLADFDFTREIGLLYAPHTDVPQISERPEVTLLAETIERGTVSRAD